MADQQILQYIVTQERSGYTEAQIRQALASQGYQPGQVEAAFKELQASQIDPVIHEYVQQYARQGMPPVQVFKALTDAGYAPGKVRKSIVDVFGPGTLASHHAVVFLIIAVVVAAGGVYFLQGSLLHPPESTTPPSGNTVQLSVQEQIGQVIAIGRTKGIDEGLSECGLRFRNDDRDMCLLDVIITAENSSDKRCDQIQDVKLRDTCLMNFLSVDKSVCGRVQLRENVDMCNNVALLQKAPST